MTSYRSPCAGEGPAASEGVERCQKTPRLKYGGAQLWSHPHSELGRAAGPLSAPALPKGGKLGSGVSDTALPKCVCRARHALIGVMVCCEMNYVPPDSC